MRIGHFPGLKGYDAVLISCERGDVNILRSVAREAVASRSPVSVNERCDVSETVPAQLQLVAAATGVHVSSAVLKFTWRIDPAFHSSLDGLLEGLVGPSGHQYFDVDGKNAALVVSVGEYDENWWRKASAEAAAASL